MADDEVKVKEKGKKKSSKASPEAAPSSEVAQPEAQPNQPPDGVLEMSETAEAVVTPAVTAKKVAPEVTPVTMEDGRVVGFTGKVQMYKEIVLDGGKPGVRFDFRNGQTALFLVPEALTAYAAGHGYAQKLGDEVAGLKDKDGQAASPEDKMLAIEALHDRISSSGDWNKVAAGGGAVSGASIVIKALMEASGKTMEEIKAFIEGKLAKAEAAGQKLTRAALYTSLRNPTNKIGQIIERLEREKLAKTPAVDSDEMLAELRGE